MIPRVKLVKSEQNVKIIIMFGWKGSASSYPCPTHIVIIINIWKHKKIIHLIHVVMNFIRILTDKTKLMHATNKTFTEELKDIASRFSLRISENWRYWVTVAIKAPIDQQTKQKIENCLYHLSFQAIFLLIIGNIEFFFIHTNRTDPFPVIHRNQLIIWIQRSSRKMHI